MPCPPHPPWLKSYDTGHITVEFIDSVQRQLYWHIICISINRK
jgi:hypothetical protein